MLQRFEVNVRTGIRIEIDQKAYRNEEGDVIVLDVGSTIPEGFEEIVPEVDEE